MQFKKQGHQHFPMKAYVRVPPNLLNGMCNTPYCTPQKVNLWQESELETRLLENVTESQEHVWLQEWVADLVRRELSTAIAKMQEPVQISVQLDAATVVTIKKLLEVMGQE